MKGPPSNTEMYVYIYTYVCVCNIRHSQPLTHEEEVRRQLRDAVAEDYGQRRGQAHGADAVVAEAAELVGHVLWAQPHVEPLLADLKGHG